MTTIDKVLDFLDSHSEVSESYVLVREVSLFLDVGHDHFRPEISIKINRSNALPRFPYQFEVSHHVHTPNQASPYYPSNTHAETEIEAIGKAISTTTSFIKSAIDQGLEPSSEWLIKNENF